MKPSVHVKVREADFMGNRGLFKCLISARFRSKSRAHSKQEAEFKQLSVICFIEISSDTLYPFD